MIGIFGQRTEILGLDSKGKGQVLIALHHFLCKFTGLDVTIVYDVGYHGVNAVLINDRRFGSKCGRGRTAGGKSEATVKYKCKSGQESQLPFHKDIVLSKLYFA
jgi:hypothetical protein